MIGCFWTLLALSGSLDSRKHRDIDWLIVGRVVGIFGYLARDGLYGLDLLRNPQWINQARASRRALRVTADSVNF
jgi:hypothetical protein